jgi:hypothetical protein
MRKVVLGTVAGTLLLAGMLTGNSEAAPLRGCCNVAALRLALVVAVLALMRLQAFRRESWTPI